MKKTLLSIDIRLRTFADGYSAIIIKDDTRGAWDLPRDFESRQIAWSSSGMEYTVQIYPATFQGRGNRCKKWLFGIVISKTVNDRRLYTEKYFLEDATKNALINNIDEVLNQAKNFISQVSESDLTEVTQLS